MIIGFLIKQQWRLLALLKELVRMLKDPYHLPTLIEKFTILKSPHVDKKSRDQLELRTHKRMMDITEWTPQTVDALQKLELAAGVDIEIKL